MAHDFIKKERNSSLMQPLNISYLLSDSKSFFLVNFHCHHVFLPEISLGVLLYFFTISCSILLSISLSISLLNYLFISFRSQNILIFILTFWSCRRNGLIRKIRLISRFLTSQPRQQTIPIHILPNISQSKCNQTLKFGPVIE